MKKPWKDFSIEAKSLIPVVAILGPTASGKSGLAEFLASRCGGELVNSDASAFYQELSVGVTKPSAQERQRTVYHLLDTTSLEKGYDLMEFLQEANRVIDDIHARSRLPIVVGGSGLYARALLDGYRPPQIEVSEQTRQAVRLLPLEQALEQLFRLDPVNYERIDRQNPRRVVRALELAKTVGGPVPAPRIESRPDRRLLRLYLMPTKNILDRRIARRTGQMWEGWLEEVDHLEKKGLAGWLKERKPIGYSSVQAYLHGELSREEAQEEIVRLTIKLAKKQRTWLRKESEHPFSHHFHLEREEDWSRVPEEALKRVNDFLGAELDR